MTPIPKLLNEILKERLPADQVGEFVSCILFFYEVAPKGKHKPGLLEAAELVLNIMEL